MADDVARWRRLESVVHAALARPAEERAAFLVEACSGDSDLRREAASLLEREGHAGAFLGAPLDALAAGAMSDSPDSRPALTTGQTLAHYRIVKAIGAGGMGQVYLAEDTRLDRQIALKIMPTELADDADRRARFTREAKAIAALNHPNIVTVYAVEEADGLYFITMELVRGRTLAELLPRHGFALGKFLALAIPLTDALAAAHQNGITHRDVKPTNVMVTDDGRVKVLDFGLAKAQLDVWHRDGTRALRSATEDGHIVGTPPYMSPEQAEGKTVDARSDIFSLGIVFYEMLTGQRPFVGDSATAMLSSILHDTPRSLSEIKPALPRRLGRLVHRCLEKNPVDRYQSALDLRHDLEDLQRDEESGDAVPIRPSRSRSRRGMTIGWGLAAVVVVAAAGLFLSGWRSVSPASPRPIGRFVIAPAEGAVMSSGPLALSSDGRHLVYGARSGNASRLYLRALAHLESRALPGTDGGILPTFSPDGQWVAFVADDKLKKVGVFSDGPPVTLGELTDCCAGGALTWLPDDRIVGGLMGDGIVAISARGGAPVFITKPDTSRREFDLHSPRWLPGGNWMLVGIHRGAETFDVAAIHAESGERRVLVENAFDARYVSTGHLVFARPGVLLAAPFDIGRLEVTGPTVPLIEGVLTINGDGAARYQLADDGSLAYIPAVSVQGRRLLWIDRLGNEEPLGIGTRGFIAPSLSPRGDRVALQVIEPTRRDIFVYDLASGAITRVTFDGTNAGPIWTPDGERLVFSSTKDGPRQVYWQAANGIGPPELLVADDHSLWAGSWSPDGRTLAYVRSSPTGQTDIALVRIGEKPTIAVANVAADQWPQISPDGRWLAYVSSDTGKFEVYVSPLDDLRGKRQLSTDGGHSPRWSRDSRELFFRSSDRLMVVPVEALPAATPRPTALSIRIRMADGTAAHPGYDISPDGRRLLIVERADDEAVPPRAFLVLNWFEELRQRVPTR